MPPYLHIPVCHIHFVGFSCVLFLCYRALISRHFYPLFLGHYSSSNGLGESISTKSKVHLLLYVGKEKYAEKSRSQLDNQSTGLDVDETSCDLCRSYFPLLKSFIFHIESCHKGTAAGGQAGCFKCNLCDVESDTAITLGMHALLHVCGKAPSKEMHMSSMQGLSQGNAQQSETATGSKQLQNSSGNRHISTRMYTRLLEQSVKNTTGDNVAC